MKQLFTPDEKDIMRIRRRIAIVSFCSVLVTLGACFGVVFYGSDNTASNMQAVSPIIITILGLLTTLVLNYFYHSHYKGTNEGSKAP